MNTPITIRGNDATIQRANYGCNFPPQPTQVPFRLLVVNCSGSVASCGRLTLEDLTLSGGCALGVAGSDVSASGGAIFNAGEASSIDLRTRIVPDMIGANYRYVLGFVGNATQRPAS